MWAVRVGSGGGAVGAVSAWWSAGEGAVRAGVWWVGVVAGEREGGEQWGGGAVGASGACLEKRKACGR